MFQKHARQDWTPLLPGIAVRTLVYGEKTLLVEFQLLGGSHLPRHAHPYEQTGYLVSGRMRLTAGSDVLEAGPGDSWCIPAGMEHEAEILEDALAVEVFSPVREDYLPEKLAERRKSRQ